MRLTSYLVATLNLGGVFLSMACNTTKTDDDWITELVLGSSFFGTRSATGQGGASAADSLNPWVWYREVTSYPSPVIDISRVGDSAHVYFEGTAIGTLHNWAWDIDSSKYKTFLKPFTDRAVVEAVFKKSGPGRDHGGWELYAVSGVLGGSSPTTVGIDSVRMTFSSGGDTLIANPREMFYIADLLTLSANDTIYATAYTHGATADAFFHLLGPNNESHRITMQPDTLDPTVFRATFDRSANNPGLHFLVVDLMEFGVLHDSDSSASYDALLWFMPYEVI